jgi:CRISPR-associated protein Csx17
MRQLLLPVDPADSAHPRGRWRDSPVVPGFGLRPLRDVLADVLAWRSRMVANESGAEAFHGVPTFRLGIRVPAADLHAFACGQLNLDDLDRWLRAFLALGWRKVRHSWPVTGHGTLVPTLGLLHPLADGVGDQDEAGAPKLAMGPDWAVRLAAGQVQSVHVDAARRLRQAGWDAVPALGVAAADGTAIAAALVPRCFGEREVLDRFAVRFRTAQQDNGTADEADYTDDDEQETNSHEAAEEL